MHILFLTTYFEPDSGAAAVRLSRLAHFLHARGHQITVLTAMPHYPQGRIADTYRGEFALVEDRDGLRVIRTWLWATPSSKISRRLLSQLSFMLTAAVRGVGIERPDVMLIEAQPVFTSLAGYFLSRFKRVPYVLNISDLWPDHLLSVGALSETHLAYRIARRMVDMTYRGAAGIVAMSPAWAEKIKGYIASEEKIQVIHNGVDLSRFHPNVDASDFQSRYGLKHQKVISFIGTFATQYDFETMLSVVERMQARGDVCFMFVGGGTQSDAVRARLNGLANVLWIDWINHTEIPLAWAASHMTFWAMRDHPLYRGTIPAKLYETLASGIPVAAAHEGEGAAMVERSGAGLTVNCGNVEGLVGAVERLLDDSELHARCRRSARGYAEAFLDPEKVAIAYEAVLKRAAGES
jgi:glycosyltransferase involved in cell wall biosynthesis